jgi:uncharacterized Zn-binding protein involved in type VI secretion
MSKIARLGDSSSHGGTIISTNQDNTVTANSIPIAVAGAMHSCPITGHGTTSITPITVKTYINNKLVLTIGAVAGCGAVINTGSPNIFAE